MCIRDSLKRTRRRLHRFAWLVEQCNRYQLDPEGGGEKISFEPYVPGRQNSLVRTSRADGTDGGAFGKGMSFIPGRRLAASSTNSNQVTRVGTHRTPPQAYSYKHANFQCEIKSL